MPHETAPAHRHTAFAMRFVIEGSGGFTAVHGKRIKMNRGDVILTPTWNWHDHGKDGSGPMIWLDALDLPLFQFFPVHFVEHFKESRYPAEDVETSESELVFPWAAMKDSLDAKGSDANGVDWVKIEYRKSDGRYGKSAFRVCFWVAQLIVLVSKTLNPSAERICAGKASQERRETTSCVYHVISGRGKSVINDETLEWKVGDTFCVPSWHKYQHFAAEDETVYLYRFDDKPMIEALGFYRWEGMDTGTLVS
jgi:gentisate 1,2-dioxygenase